MLTYLPYILLISILFIGSLLEVVGFRKDQMKYVRWGILTFLFIFIGFRFNTGADWYLYIKEFLSISANGKDIMGWEPGFVALNSIVSILFGNYYVIQVLASFFLLYAVNKTYTKYSSYPILSISLFVIIFLAGIMMAQVRQSIALSIILLGTQYIFEKKFYRYLGVVFMACLFHISAVVALPLYFLNRRINKYTVLVLMLFPLVFYFYPNIVIDLIDVFSPYLPERLSALVEVYKDSFFARKAEFGTGLYFIATIFIYIITVLLVDYKEKNYFYVNTLMVLVIILGLSNVVSIIGRFSSYYYSYAIIAIISLLDIKYKPFSKSVTNLFIYNFIFFFFLFRLIVVLTQTQISPLTGRAGNYGYVPYYNLIYHPDEANERLDWVEKGKK